jgi:flagellar biosynthesis protein FliP
MSMSQRRGARSALSLFLCLAAGLFLAILGVPGEAAAADGSAPGTASASRNGGDAAAKSGAASVEINKPAELETPARLPINLPDKMGQTMQNVVLFGLFSLAPVALLMVTSFVRINIVLILLRQALGSPQVPGNQVLTALACLLTALGMRPVGELVYHDAIVPYQTKKLDEKAAWAAGSRPIKAWMVHQIVKYKHEDYLHVFLEYAVPPSPGRVEPAPAVVEDFPLTVVAPAFLLSELTTAFMIGFVVYLPFLVIDLVVSSVLAATGLFMLPPTLVSMPVKLIVFVLADGWMLVATMLLESFSIAPGGP